MHKRIALLLDNDDDMQRGSNAGETGVQAPFQCGSDEKRRFEGAQLFIV
jgi:hypothetical protein